MALRSSSHLLLALVVGILTIIISSTPPSEAGRIRARRQINFAPSSLTAEDPSGVSGGEGTFIQGQGGQGPLSMAMMMPAPRQIFIPPPQPPCRGSYVRVDGSCRPTFGPQIFYPALGYSDGRTSILFGAGDDPSTNEVPVDDNDDGGAAVGEEGADSLSQVDRELEPSPPTEGVRVPKRPTPSFVSVPRSTGGGAAGGGCPPGMAPDRNGKCRRRFNG